VRIEEAERWKRARGAGTGLGLRGHGTEALLNVTGAFVERCRHTHQASPGSSDKTIGTQTDMLNDDRRSQRTELPN
jgi:hypothetical protein